VLPPPSHRRQSKTKEHIKKEKARIKMAIGSEKGVGFQQNLCKLCRTPLTMVIDVSKKKKELLITNNH
jgi:hypothetical protein